MSDSFCLFLDFCLWNSIHKTACLNDNVLVKDGNIAWYLLILVLPDVLDPSSHHKISYIAQLGAFSVEDTL